MSTAQLDLQVMEHLNERQRRLYAATQALKYGYGGIKKVHDELGMDENTIRRGIQDVAHKPLLNRVQKRGGGRKKAVALYPELPKIVRKPFASGATR